jgi:hypothetical protein
MAFNFPSNPSLNDTYSYNGRSWVFNGNAWIHTRTENLDITTTGNVTANSFIGDGSQLTGLPAGYTDSNVASYLPTHTGNITAGNILTDNYFYANGDPFTSYTDTDVETLLSGNITAGNISVTGTIDGYATTSYVDSEVANLVASAPATLDTLNELASALGDDANFATTVTNLIGNNSANITTLQGNITTLESDITNLEANIPANLQSNVTTLEGNVTSIESDITTLQGNITTLESDITNLEANIPANLQSNVTTLESDVSTLQGNIVTLDNQVANLNYYDDTNVTTFLSDLGSNSITTTGNITADYFVGNGSALTGINAGANVTFSTSAPLSPSEGDVWIDSNIGVQLIYIDDGDSGQWVDFQSTINNYGGESGGNYGDSNVLSYLGNISGNLIPSANVTYDLGSETNRWNTLYLAGNTINLGGAQIKADPGAGTIALIPQVKDGESATKAIIVGNRGISTVDTDANGSVSSADIESAVSNPNPTLLTYTTANLLPLINNIIGDQAFVTATNRLYIWNGTGWYNIAIVNTTPTITGGYNSFYAFEENGTPIVVTLVGNDPEGLPITWDYEVTSGTLGNTATINQSDNVFTITPSTDPASQGTFSVTWKVSDGINIGTAVSEFTLLFYNLYGTYYTNATQIDGYTGNIIILSYSGSGTDSINSTIDAMSDGDALLLNQGQYSVSATTGNDMFRGKDIAIVGKVADPKDVVLTIINFTERDKPIFNQSFGAGYRHHIANMRIIRTGSNTNYIAALKKGGSGGYARNCIIDLNNTGVSWIYDNSAFTTPIVTFENCTFLNYSSWLTNYSGSVLSLRVINCAFDDTYNTDGATFIGTNQASVSFDGNYAYTGSDTYGHLCNIASLTQSDVITSAPS